DLVAPALGQPSAHLGIVQQLVGELVSRERRRAKPRESAERFRLPGRDRASQPDEWRRWWCVAARRRNRLVLFHGFGRVAVRRRNRLVPLIGIGWCGAVMHHLKSRISCRWLPGTRPQPRTARLPGHRRPAARPRLPPPGARSPPVARRPPPVGSRERPPRRRRGSAPR